MNQFYEIIIPWIISVFSALIVFYLSERIKSIAEDRILLKKLSIELFEMIVLLTRFESSSKQFIKIINTHRLQEIWSIWFPKYVFHNFKENIPNILYYSKDIYYDFIRLNRICFILNDLMQDLMINDIKNDLLTKQVSIEESEKRYHYEQFILKSTLNQIPQYISLVKKLNATIHTINNHKSIFNFIHIKTNFNKEKINNEIEKIDYELKNNFSKTEEIET
jgi:hypothetical protein